MAIRHLAARFISNRVSYFAFRWTTTKTPNGRFVGNALSMFTSTLKPPAEQPTTSTPIDRRLLTIWVASSSNFLINVMCFTDYPEFILHALRRKRFLCTEAEKAK